MNQPHIPFSRPVLVATIPDHGLQTTIEATADERATLAETDGIVAIEHLSARFELTRHRAGQGVGVRGELMARVVQTCTVSLDAFESELREPFDLLFLPAGASPAGARDHDPDMEIDLAAEDPPEVYHDGRIDLGAIAAEFLALGLDPYPRKPGVAFEAERYAGEKEPSPFAALARLKQER
jgi:uncharacterized metal-binding protein YceD (DUF177 family)